MKHLSKYAIWILLTSIMISFFGCKRPDVELISNKDITWGVGFGGVSIMDISGHSKMLAAKSKPPEYLLQNLLDLMDDADKYAAAHVILVMWFSGTKDFPFQMTSEGVYWFEMQVEFDEKGKEELFPEQRHKLKNKWEVYLFGDS